MGASRMIIRQIKSIISNIIDIKIGQPNCIYDKNHYFF